MLRTFKSTTVVFFLFCTLSPMANAGLQLLVPAYFYPSADPALSFWDEMTAAQVSVDVTAIMNPASGPGVAQNLDYVAAVNAHRAAGGKVIGYVHTSYGARDAATVKAEIDAYTSFYGIDGIFLDEMSNLAGDLSYYQELFSYIKGVDAAYQVVGNPGINTLEDYLDVADVLVTFERDTGYPGHVPSAWNANHAAERFANLLYDVPDQAKMQSYLDLAVERNVGYVYVTDDAGANPWDQLPSYWPAEVDALATANAAPLPGSLILLLAGLALGARATQIKAAAD